MKPLLLVALSLFSFLNAFTQVNRDEEAIRQILHRQVKDWNTGNIENFMKGYWNNDSLLYIGKSGPRYGYRTTLENYKKNYSDTAAMGKLHFNILEVKPLSDSYFFVVGKWHLQRSIGYVEGHFTLLFKKIKGEWLIVADHSS